MKIDKAAIMEATQEVLRVALFGAVSAAVAYGIKQFGGQDQTQLVVIVGTFLLKWVDKYINDSKFTKLNGLTDTRIITGLK